MRRFVVVMSAVTGVFGFLVSCSTGNETVNDPRDSLRHEIDSMVSNYVEPEDEILPVFASSFTAKSFQNIPWVAQASRIRSLHLVYSVGKSLVTMNLDRTARKITKYTSEPGVATAEDAWQWNRDDHKQYLLRTIYAVMMDPAIFPAKVSVRTQNAYSYQDKQTREEITESRLTVNDPSIGYDIPYACARFDVEMKEIYGGGSAAVYVASNGFQNPVRIDYTDKEKRNIRLEFSYADFHGISLPTMIAVSSSFANKPADRVVMTLKEQDIKLTQALAIGINDANIETQKDSLKEINADDVVDAKAEEDEADAEATDEESEVSDETAEDDSEDDGDAEAEDAAKVKKAEPKKADAKKDDAKAAAEDDSEDDGDAEAEDAAKVKKAEPKKADAKKDDAKAAADAKKADAKKADAEDEEEDE